MKNKILYIVSSFIGSYFTYLICRLYDFDIISIVTIELFFLLLFFLATKKIYKIIKIAQVKDKKIIIIGSLLSLIVLFLNFNFFTAKYEPATIEIIGKNVAIDDIKSIFLNNQMYLKNDDKFLFTYDIWYNKGEQESYKNIKIKQHSSNKLQLSFKKNYSIKIYLNKDKKIKVKEKGKINKINNYKDFSYYEVKTNTVYDNYFIVRIILSAMTLEYIFLMLLVCYKNGTKYKKGLLATAVFAFIIGLMYFKNTLLVEFTNDSYSYIAYNFSNLLKLKPDLMRTPGYPFIVRIINILFNKNFLEFVSIIQYLFWFVAIIYLYKTLYLVLKNGKMAFIFSIIYAISPTITSWNGIILTESVALSGTLVFIYYVINYILNKHLKDASIAIIISLLLSFIRPTSIIFLFGLLLFFIIKFFIEKDNRKEIIKCLIVNFIAILILLIYAIIFYFNYHIFSINGLIVRQDLVVCIEQKYYKDSNDKKFIQYIDTALEENDNNYWKAMEDVFGRYSINDLKKRISYCKSKNKKEYAKYIVNLLRDYASTKFDSYSYSNTNPNLLWIHYALYNSFVIITFFHVYVIIVINGLVFLKKYISTKKIHWISLGMCCFPLVIVVSSFIGTCGEFMRTAIACIPFTFISIIILINSIIHKEEL